MKLNFQSATESWTQCGMTIAYLDNNDSMLRTLNKCSLSLELEDDADDDYKIDVEEWSFF